MKPFEYLLVLAAVILGLAIADLATSMHRLIGAGKRVRWDWLAPLAGVLSLVAIVVQWWNWYGADSLINGLTFAMYLLVVTNAVLQFLMAACALPDESTEVVIDLRAHFRKISSRFWGLFTVHWIIVQLINIWTETTILHAKLNLLSPLWLIVPTGISLVIIKNRTWQLIGLLGFVGLYLFVYSNRTLV
jgi:hypothetical protein